MRVRCTFRRTLIALGVSLVFAAPQHLSAAPFRGGIGRAIAEQLGLLVSMVPEQLPLNTPVLITVVSPDRLLSQGLTGIKANDQVRVTLLDGGKLSIVPVAKATTTQTISSTTAIKTAIVSPTATGSVATASTLQQQSLLLTVDTKGTITNTKLVPLDAKLNLDATQIIKR